MSLLMTAAVVVTLTCLPMLAMVAREHLKLRALRKEIRRKEKLIEVYEDLHELLGDAR